MSTHLQNNYGSLTHISLPRRVIMQRLQLLAYAPLQRHIEPVLLQRKLIIPETGGLTNLELAEHTTGMLFNVMRLEGFRDVSTLCLLDPERAARMPLGKVCQVVELIADAP